ncbi:hypothetical protein [Flavobacterium sp. 3HN19-14]|uniref:hypothetical protein n=1 Tax=Flavobacterium sp. 3HN19-14 TaxID=3448133 RepID=UPI003EE1C01A
MIWNWPFGITIIEQGYTDNSLFMTLPTGGDEVMLANGFPLYGTRYITVTDNATDPATEKQVAIETPCYEPLMRLTACTPDRAGNVWAANNWKPSAYTDIHSDPGGDGAVIFVGVAAPAK